MKSLVIAGVLLVVLGMLGLFYDKITFKTQEEVLRVGTIQAFKEKNKTLSVPPAVSALALGGGLVLVLFGLWRLKEGHSQ